MILRIKVGWGNLKYCVVADKIYLYSRESVDLTYHAKRVGKEEEVISRVIGARVNPRTRMERTPIQGVKWRFKKMSPLIRLI